MKCSVQQEYVFYHTTEFIEENFDIEVAYSIHSKNQLISTRNIQLYELSPEPVVASPVYKGPFIGMGDALLELFTWLGINGYSPTGAVRELLLFGRENDYHDCSNVVVELQVPVSK